MNLIARFRLILSPILLATENLKLNLRSRGVVRGGALGPWPHLVLAGLWGTPMGHTHGPTSFWRLGPTSVKNLTTRLGWCIGTSNYQKYIYSKRTDASCPTNNLDWQYGPNHKDLEEIIVEKGDKQSFFWLSIQNFAVIIAKARTICVDFFLRSMPQLKILHHIN